MSGRGRGRGAFFKAKYGGGSGGGRGRGGPGLGNNPGNDHQQTPTNSGVTHGSPTSITSNRGWTTLKSTLHNLNGQQYGAYNQLRGSYSHSSPDFILSIDHVQGDAYAAPSRVKVRMNWDETGLPHDYATSDIRAIALADYLSRTAANFIRTKHMDDSLIGAGWSGPKGGAFNINAPGQEVLPRTSAMVLNSPQEGGKVVELRFTVSLPARGRTILGQQAFEILGVNLPELVQAVLLYSNQDTEKLKTHVESVEDQHHMRNQLSKMGLIAFVANGAILPRASGASSRPLSGNDIVRFQAPPSLEVMLNRLHGTDVCGMGISEGITLLTGGGYHGKSTLLEALELGVYNHIPGDGRELIVTDHTAVKIRAEDGRSVTGTDISPFIKNLPGGRNTTSFTTDDASGSTSMAASIQEALEVGCKTLMIDEDSSATNLLVRDERMQSLIRQEPITPLVSKVQALYHEHGTSTIIVVGGLGDWLSVADRIVCMDSYIPQDLTEQAKSLVKRYPRTVGQEKVYGSLPKRVLTYPSSVIQAKTPYAKTKGFIILPAAFSSQDPSESDAGIDVSNIDQLVESGQTKLIAHTIPRLAREASGNDFTSAVARFKQDIDIERCLPETLVGGDLVAIRGFELSAAISRLRGLIVDPAVTTNATRKKARIDHR